MIVLGTMAAMVKNSGHFEIIKGYQIAKIPIWLNSTTRDLSFDMSHNVLRATFDFALDDPGTPSG